jgi:hypothetical protein
MDKTLIIEDDRDIASLISFHPKVQIYDNGSFGMVNNLATALSAPVMEMDAAMVNCPIVWIQIN